MVYQLLEATVILDRFLKFAHLFAGNIAGNILALFITLMIVIRPLRAVADNADGAAVQALDLSDFLKDRFGSRCWIHCARVYAIHIYERQ